MENISTVASGLNTAPNIQLACAWEGNGLLGVVNWANAGTDFLVYTAPTTESGDGIGSWTTQSYSTTSETIPNLSFDQSGSPGYPNAILVWNNSDKIYAATYYDSTWSDSGMVLSNMGATAATPWVSAYHFTNGIMHPLQGIAIWESTTSGVSEIQSATLNYTAPAPPPGPGGRSVRSFSRPASRRSIGEI